MQLVKMNKYGKSVSVAFFHLKLLMARGSASGTPRQHSAEKAVREIQIFGGEICNFHTLASAIHQVKDTLLVNLPIVSDFKKALQRKHNI
jgi:hypothetical protein